jgi:hypothetical protein
MIASLKFFLGQDEKELNAEGESDDDGDDNKVDRQAQINNAAAVSIKKEDVYRAYAKVMLNYWLLNYSLVQWNIQGNSGENATHIGGIIKGATSAMCDI